MDIKKELLKTVRNSIRLNIGSASDESGLKIGATRFGGKPDIPEGFEWPYFEGEGYESETKNRPLSFIAQFNLEEISRYDTENLLPKTGVLSFFYELNSMAWGYDPEDKGCARVYWFEDANALHTADFTEDMEECFRLPALKITAASEKSYQSGVDFMLQREDAMIERWDEFDEVQEKLGIDEDGEISKLLGWANPIQGNMTMECELVSRGYYLGSGWDDVTPLDRQEAEQWSAQDWLPLFQLDSVEDGDFELMFGDCGRIFYYIRRDDLAARKFDDVWLILQCC
ncbi:MAG: DUF1963 domain-containing protein [Oscillospiraceae bacterium]|nr:DUF1963 domain-containing protein [Oscillospiraceae bacterium]